MLPVNPTWLGYKIQSEETMKKYLLTVLVVFSMLVMLVGTAAAAPLAAGTATLVGVEYVPGKGPVFTFSVSGKFSKADLKGSLQVEGGASFNLHCTKVDDSTVKCTASKKVAGENVVLSWGGGTFWAHVPGAPEFCYSIWDWWDFTGNEWTDFGPNCQPMRANAGDTITYTVPDPSGSFESDPVEFFDEDVSGNCDPPVPYNGPAYYFPGCP